MSRLNLTLDSDTYDSLDRYAQRHKRALSAVARELLKEALGRRQLLEKQRKLARDYSDGRADASELLADLERAQLDLLDETESK
jgi:hypothetical protein